MKEIGVSPARPEELSAEMEINIQYANFAAKLLQDPFLTYLLGQAVSYLEELRRRRQQ